MSANYKKLGEIIELIDERNKALETSEVLGISIDKEFMPSVANTIGTDLSNYKLLRKNTFACNPMHVGRDERLPVSLYKKDIPAIVSPAYFMFKVKDENDILPEFLMLIFKRADFDRNCWFKTDGSVRGGITWDDICEIKVPVPDLKEQQKIVNTYNAITKRIHLKQKINENLEKTAQTIYKKMFCKENKDWKNGFVVDVLQLQRGHDLPRTEMRKGDYPVAGSTEIIGFHNEYTTQSPVIVMGRSGNIGKPRIYFCDCWVHNTALYVKRFFDSEPIWCFYLLKNLNYSNFTGGSAVPTLDRKVVHSQTIRIPPVELQKNFSNKVKILLLRKKENENAISKLQELKHLVISRISGM